MSTISFSIAQKRVQAVTEAVELWQIDHEEARFVHDVEELVRETTSLLEPVMRIAEPFKTGIRTVADRELLVEAHNVGWLLTKTSDVFSSVRSSIEDAGRLGHTVEGADQFNRAEREIDRLQYHISRTWLLPERKVVTAAKEDLAAGRFRTL